MYFKLKLQSVFLGAKKDTEIKIMYTIVLFILNI